MDIRPAQDQDVEFEAYCRLLTELDSLHSQAEPRYYRSPERPARPRDYFRSLCGEGEGGLFLAWQGSEAVGLLSFDVQTFAHPVVVPRRMFYINDMVVAGAHQRRGVGRALMAAARAWAQAHACTDLRLAVQTFNQGALAFYQAQGFAVQTIMLVRALD